MSNKLQFKNGKFKIMLVGDPHEKFNDSSKKDIAQIKDYLALQYAALKAEKPDLVILLGDNAGADSAEKLKATLLRMTKPYSDNNVPFSFILGNHDLECNAVNTLNEQYEIYKTLPYCILPEKNEINSYGDYCISIFSENENKPALNIWHFYSGNHAEPKYHSNYDFVKEEQIEWYKNKAAEFSHQYGFVIPAVAIQHIPVPEELNLIKKCNPVRAIYNGVLGQYEQKGSFFVLDKLSGTNGYMGEGPCVSAYNSGEFNAWKETGDVFAAFFGHDHMNDFVGMTDGIILGQCKTASFRAYGDGLMQGVRILEFSESAPRQLNTRMVRYRELIGSDCNSLSGSTKIFRDAYSVRFELAGKALLGLTLAAVPVIAAKLIKKISKNK